MAYEHTQDGKLQWILWGAAVVCLIGAFLTWSEAPWAAWLYVGCAALSGGMVAAFSSLTVRDEGEALGVRFGPVPLLRTRIPYADITDPRPARSKIIDGWGVHWVPGRGWTWNLWTFDCVEMRVRGKPFRVGTDDREALAAFLREKVSGRD